jgi:hypothetical protein
VGACGVVVAAAVCECVGMDVAVVDRRRGNGCDYAVVLHHLLPCDRAMCDRATCVVSVLSWSVTISGSERG